MSGATPLVTARRAKVGRARRGDTLLCDGGLTPRLQGAVRPHGFEDRTEA